MTTINSYSKPEAREPLGSVPQCRRALGSGAWLFALCALGAAFAVGCAGELDKDPNSFSRAFATDSTGNTGGSVGNTGGSATGGSATGGSQGVPPDDSCVAAVFSSKSCTLCHSNASAASIGAGLVLEGTNLGARLSTTVATYKGASNASACVAGALIIDPVTPANSILLKKVSGTQACGDPMPSSPGLSGTDLQCITDWINKF